MADFSILSLIRGIPGIIILIGIGFLLSEDKKHINWKQVGIGLIIQVLLALGFLYIPFISFLFECLAKVFIKLVDFTRAGTGFLLGDLIKPDKYGFVFLFQALPNIIFFAALTSILYYWGIIQKVVYGMTWLFKKILRISGPEGLAATGNVFLGLSEVPLLIKAYLPKMNKSELFLLMTAGMSTVAAGVLGTCIDMLGGSDPQTRLFFAKHLIAASVMAAPGAIVFAKIIIPQTGQMDDSFKVVVEPTGKNFLDSITNGAIQGVKIFINVAAILLAFIAFIALLNYLLGDIIGHYFGLNDQINSYTNGQFKELNLQFILGNIFAPIMWLIGVSREDMALVGSLLGQKMAMNEIVAFMNMNMVKNAGGFVSQKSIVMTIYLLCGFANFGSVGMQIGAISSIAPGTREWVTKYGFKSMLAGTLVSAMSATIVGMLITG